MNPIKTYVGFANKSGATIKGLDDIKKSRKRIYLILCTQEIMENSRIKVEEYSTKNQIPIIKIEKSIFDELNIGGVKILAITDKNLASAIIKLA